MATKKAPKATSYPIKQIRPIEGGGAHLLLDVGNGATLQVSATAKQMKNVNEGDICTVGLDNEITIKAA